ncbi:MAG: GNAT family N-acetyltransferase [Clostridiaceae bacterium]|nr:GNAT family N-acetyltransferase [Clostridiaceae bacterium]
MDTRIEIRFLTNTSWEEIAETFNKAFSDYSMNMSYMSREVLFARSVKNGVDLSISPGLFYDNSLVGFTLIGIGEWKNQTGAFDAATGIIKEFRGKGYANELFNFALPELLKRHVSVFVLEALQNNSRAIKAYQKAGFKIIREFDCYSMDLDRPLALKTKPLDYDIKSADKSILNKYAEFAEWEPSWECNRSAMINSDENMVYYEAFFQDKPMGFISFNRKLHWIMNLFVMKEYRQKGVATYLLHKLIAEHENFSGGKVRYYNIPPQDYNTKKTLDKVGFSKVVSQFEMELDLMP